MKFDLSLLRYLNRFKHRPFSPLEALLTVSVLGLSAALIVRALQGTSIHDAWMPVLLTLLAICLWLTWPKPPQKDAEDADDQHELSESGQEAEAMPSSTGSSTLNQG